mgnify:CR=1 FL=1
MTDNKRYWDQLKKTDPKYTKRINKGFGEITTIDPQWQIGKMTEVFGSVQKLWRKTGALDDEAPKKAMTDAMTKALSHLGMSADVFLGMFDNSKYVEKVAAEYKSLNKSKVTEMKGNT